VAAAAAVETTAAPAAVETAAAPAAVETTSAAMAAIRQMSHDAVRRSQGVHRVTLNRLG
jgi:hypothetical protein